MVDHRIGRGSAPFVEAIPVPVHERAAVESEGAAKHGDISVPPCCSHRRRIAGAANRLAELVIRKGSCLSEPALGRIAVAQVNPSFYFGQIVQRLPGGEVIVRPAGSIVGCDVVIPAYLAPHIASVPVGGWIGIDESTGLLRGFRVATLGDGRLQSEARQRQAERFAEAA